MLNKQTNYNLLCYHIRQLNELLVQRIKDCEVIFLALAFLPPIYDVTLSQSFIFLTCKMQVLFLF